MRVFVVFAALIGLAACGPNSAPAPEAEAPVEAAAPAADAADADNVQGPFEAVSNTAMSITGDMSFSDADVSFMNGIVLRTTHVGTQSAFDAVNAQGDTYDDVAPGGDDRVVDLRRVDAQELTDAAQGICGDTAPTYVALLQERVNGPLGVAVFSGAEAPGPSATESALCATFLYASQ